MNMSSVQLAPATQAALPTMGAQSSGKAGGAFGSVLAGMTKTAQLATADTPTDQLDSLLDTIGELLSVTEVDSLAESLVELTGLPIEDIQASLVKLTQASSTGELAETIGQDPTELLETITGLLEETGVSKEQLSEIMYSNDIWTLLNVVNDNASKLSAKLEGMLNSDDITVKQQATDVLAFLKTAETILPTKDLLGWQQASLTQLSEQLDGIQIPQIVQGMKEPKKQTTEMKFATVLNSPVTQTLQTAPVTENPKAIKLETEQNMQRTVLQTMTVVTENGQEQASQEGKSEQNQSQLIQNPTVQPIVSRSVFSLETPEARPATQSDVLLEKLQGLFKQTSFGQLGGTNRLLVKLYPEHLGQVRIELLQVNGVMTARILASTALGKQMLDSQLHQLKQSFVQQNIQVDRIDVTQAVQDPSRNDRNHNFNQQQFKGNEEQPEQQNHEPEEQQSFQEFLLDVEV